MPPPHVVVWPFSTVTSTRLRVAGFDVFESPTRISPPILRRELSSAVLPFATVMARMLTMMPGLSPCTSKIRSGCASTSDQSTPVGLLLPSMVTDPVMSRSPLVGSGVVVEMAAGSSDPVWVRW